MDAHLTEISEGQGRAVEAALALQRTARERLDVRRSYEWKVTLGIWVALLLAGRELLDLAAGATGQMLPAWQVLAGSLLVLAIHAFWIFGYVQPSNFRDSKEALQIEVAIRSTIGLPPVPLPADTPAKFATFRSYSWKAGVVEVALTALIVLLLVALT